MHPAHADPEPCLFDLSTLPTKKREKLLKNLQTRVWTTTKAHLIARYLKLFVYVTKHGTYLDAFAGPQDEKKLDSWAASLVLRSKPERLRHFRLFEQDERGIAHLKWWGRDDWHAFVDARRNERPVLFAERFKKELGYVSANAYPIFKEHSDTRIMFYMIHATDHDEAPGLMTRAYNKAMESVESIITDELPWSEENKKYADARRTEDNVVKRPEPIRRRRPGRKAAVG